jgi:Sigma-70 region 2
MRGSEPDRLSKISTNWQELFATASPATGVEAAAQHALVLRYCGAVYQYLLAATRDVHAADDLAQEFALRFLRGDFRRADPGRGRFRDYVKSVLFRLVADHFRSRRRSGLPLPDDDAGPIDGTADDPSAGAFVRHWRQEVLNRTWQELERVGGAGECTALRWKAARPDGRSEDGARELTAALGREITPVAFRQALHRARETFAELLLAEVAQSIGSNEPAAVEQELAELELIDYCRPRRTGG